MSPEPERPATSTEQVVAAIRGGARTRDEIMGATDLNASIVGIALTKLYRAGVVTRVPGEYQAGRTGPRPFIYQLAGDGDVTGGLSSLRRAAQRKDAAAQHQQAAQRREARRAARTVDPNSPLIESLALSAVTLGSLRRAGIETVAELTTWTEEQLLTLRRFGPASLDDVVVRLADRGLTLTATPAVDDDASRSAQGGGDVAGGPET